MVYLYLRVGLRNSEVKVNIPNVLAIRMTDHKFYFVAVYRSPSYNNLENEALINYLPIFCLDKDVISLGDFKGVFYLFHRRNKC